MDAQLYRPLERADPSDLTGPMADRFNVVFAGNMGEAQHLETVLEAAALVRHIPQILFVMVGDGTATQRLRDEAAERELTNVVFLGRVAAERMPEVYAFSDVLLVHLKADPLFEITIPHKIFSYMASQKPVLAALKGDGAHLVTGIGAGLSCAPQNPHAMRDAVLSFYEMDAGARAEWGAVGWKPSRATTRARSSPSASARFAAK